MTYLELVNMALRESGADLDSLSSFSGMNSLQTKMKNWVGQAWKEVCMERDEWTYMTGQAVVDVYPRIYVEDWVRAGGIPAAGATFEGEESDWGFTLVSVDSIEGLITDANGLSAFLSVEDFDNTTFPLLNEQFEELAPVADTGAFTYKGGGRYRFQNYTDTVMISGTARTFTAIEPQLHTFSVQDIENSSTALQVVEYVPFNVFKHTFSEYPNATLGMPRVITDTPDGNYDFYPRPDTRYTIKYNYTKAVNELSLTTDVPLNLPSEYHDIIVWRALTYYAQYDNNQILLRHAMQRLAFFRNRMERRLMPQLTFGRSKFE